MDTLRGTFFDGKTSRARPAEVKLVNDRIIITHAEGQIEYPARAATAPPAPSVGVFFLEFPDGAKFEGDGLLAGFDREPQRGLEQFWKGLSVGVALIGFAALLLLWKGIPALAESWAPHLPKSATRDAAIAAQKYIGTFDDIYRSYDPQMMDIVTDLQAAHPELDIKVKLCCENKPSNAFALPDGHIVLVRSLFKELTPDQRLAVLFHEVGHLRHYHPQRTFIENRFVTGALLVAAGYGEAFGWGVTLVGAAHSREQEKEADLFAAAELIKRGKSPLLLADALEAMGAGRSGGGKTSGWLYSHPVTDERREYLRAATPPELLEMDESDTPAGP